MNGNDIVTYITRNITRNTLFYSLSSILFSFRSVKFRILTRKTNIDVAIIVRNVRFVK